MKELKRRHQEEYIDSLTKRLVLANAHVDMLDKRVGDRLREAEDYAQRVMIERQAEERRQFQEEYMASQQLPSVESIPAPNRDEQGEVSFCFAYLQCLIQTIAEI